MSGATLIVGGESRIGGALADHLRQAGQPFATTSRRPDRQSGALFLDLSGDVEDWPIPQGVATAVLCAAIPQIDACEKDPAGTARVNVAGTLALVRRLRERNIFTIFCSTTQVFDGESPHVPADAPHTPVTEYGRQKAQVERALISWGSGCAVVRCSKVLEPQFPLLARWSDALRRGETVEPFTDLRMAPVPLAGVAALLRLIADRRAGGVWQISGDRDLSYAEVAHLLAARLDVPADRVRPVSARATGRVTAHIPAHTTLCVERLRRELGVEPPPVEWTISAAFPPVG